MATGRAKVPGKWTVFRYALRHSLHPDAVLMLKAPVENSPTSIDDWVTDGESVGILKGLRHTHQKITAQLGKDWYAIANDKAAFAAFCEEHNLPHPRLFSVWDDDGATTQHATPQADEDRVWKPRKANNANGFTILKAEVAETHGAEL
ncbi:MAG: hypothetical protein AAGH17_11435, partial [Pseudomonadota bacterium]